MREHFLTNWEISLSEAFSHAIHHHWPSWAIVWISGSFFGWLLFSSLQGFYSMYDLLLIVLFLGTFMIVDTIGVLLWYKMSPGSVRVGLTNTGIHHAVHGRWLSQSPRFIPWTKVERAEFNDKEHTLLITHHARIFPATLVLTVPQHNWKKCQEIIRKVV